MVRKILYLNYDMPYCSRRHHVSMDVRQQRRPLIKFGKTLPKNTTPDSSTLNESKTDRDGRNIANLIIPSGQYWGYLFMSPLSS
jgi:hypothetical protein